MIGTTTTPAAAPPSTSSSQGSALPMLLLAALAACGGPTPTLDGQSPALSRSGGATLAASPDPVPAGESVRLAGCGYAANLAVSGSDSGPAGVRPWSGRADASGCLSVDIQAGADAGSHTLKAYQQTKRGHTTLMAQATLTVDPSPLAVTSESYFFRWDATKACVSEDDTLDWSAAGALAPGRSFTFMPRYPDCNDPRAVMVKVTTDSGADLRVSTVVPAADGVSNDPSQAGKTIVAATSNGTATLCMFPNTSFTPPAGYTITVTNVGAITASNVTVTGKDYNDWPVFYWTECLAADADGDGWSDSYEHTMAQLIYPTGNYISGSLPAGSDYLRSCGSAAPNDEFDFWPPDFDDDGVVTQADLDLLASHLGEGNGIPWSAITPNSGPANFWYHVGAWNRFDLNADGFVDSKDLDVVKGLLGARCGP